MYRTLRAIIKSLLLSLFHRRGRRIKSDESNKIEIGRNALIDCHNNEQRLSFVEKINKNWQPRYYRVDLILNDIERRLINTRREYTEFQNNKEEFILHARRFEGQINLSTSLFLCPVLTKFDSMIDLISNHRNSVICKNWKQLSPILLDLFYRLHKVLDRNNILAAKELMEVIQYHLSSKGNKDEKEAKKIAKIRIRQLEEKIEKEIIEKQQVKFRKQFAK